MRALKGVFAAAALMLLFWAAGAQDEGGFAEAPLPAAEAAAHGRFVTAETCALCHSESPRAKAMRDSRGESVAPHDLWLATMKANSARDPFWRAQVSIEQAATPAAAGRIAAKCLRCHAPAASYEARAEGRELGLEVLRAETPEGHLARDGVSCTVCHQIRPDGLGEEASFTGGFEVGDEREIYGPHAAPIAAPMRRFSGYTPRAAGHMRDAALCGSCHTLRTHSLEADGSPNGAVVLEQGPYLEWRNSAYNDELAEPGPEAKSCQACHLPTRDEAGVAIRTPLAHNPGGRDFPAAAVAPRSPYGRHLFVGGNTLIPGMLRDFPSQLQAKASPAAFDAVIARSRAQLAGRTASLAVGPAARAGERLRIPLRIENRAGHKLPSAYPSRRVYLRVRVTDKAGAERALIGAVDARGRLLGSDGAPLPSERAGGPIAPHRQVIRGADEPLIYEAVQRDGEGQPTVLLMRSRGYVKDNRLLPKGWRADGPHAEETAPQGAAAEDADFSDGADVLTLDLALPKEDGPYRLELGLYYQVLGARHEDEMRRFDTPALRDFLRMLETQPREGERLASLELELED